MSKTKAFRALLATQRGEFTSHDLIGHTDRSELFAMLCKFEGRREIECVGLTQHSVANKRLKIYKVRHLLSARPVRTYVKRDKSVKPELPENVKPWAELWPHLFTLPTFKVNGRTVNKLEAQK